MSLCVDVFVSSTCKPCMFGVNQVWCLSSEGDQESQINRTVDGAVLSILLTGLLPDIHYSVLVAAVTSLGVGAQSPPVSLLLSESLKLLQPLQIEKFGKMCPQPAEFTHRLNMGTLTVSSSLMFAMCKCKKKRKS